MSVTHIVLASFGALGTILNLTMFFVLFQIKLGSRMTIIHLRCQSVVDATLCFVTFLYKVIGKSITTGIPRLDEFFCVIWYSDSLIWLFVILSMLNIACVSLDRFVAVFFPIFYKLHQKRLLSFTFTYIVSTTLVVYTSNLLRRKYSNGTCTHNLQHLGPVVENYLRNDAYLWLVFIYIIPISFITTSHVMIIYAITKRLRNAAAATVAGTSGQANPMKRLTLSTIVMASILVLSHSYDLVSYILDALKLIQYKYLSDKQQLGVLFIVWSSCLLPCVLASCNPPIRDYLKARYLACLNLFKRKCQSNDNNNRDKDLLPESQEKRNDSF